MTDESNQNNSDQPTLIEWFRAKYPGVLEEAEKELQEYLAANPDKARPRRRNRDETE